MSRCGFVRQKRKGKKLTVGRILRRGDDFDENLTRTGLRHVHEAKGGPAFGHKGSSLLGGSHFLRTTGALCLDIYNISLTDRGPKDTRPPDDVTR
jgi:hypothetical protein